MARISGLASNLRDCPISKPGDDIWSPTPENCQASYRFLDRELVFPDDVPLYLDQVARGWTVNGEALFLQALLTINESVDMLHAKLNELELFRIAATNFLSAINEKLDRLTGAEQKKPAFKICQHTQYPNCTCDSPEVACVMLRTPGNPAGLVRPGYRTPSWF